jgi:hypothetical protein
VSVVFTKAATRLRADGIRLIATLSDGAEIESRTVVIATGVAYRCLDVPSLERFAGVAVFYGAAMSEAPTCTGEEVLIVGAGNSAGQAAIHLARFASRVTMVVRGQSLAASMSDYLIRQIGALSNIDVRLGTWVVDGHGDRRLEAVTVERVDGKREKLCTAGLFVLVGGTPHTQWLAGSIEMDAKGYILTGRDLLRSGHPPSGWRLEREPFFLGDEHAGSVRSRRRALPLRQERRICSGRGRHCDTACPRVLARSMIAAKYRLFSAEPKASKFPRYAHTEKVAALGISIWDATRQVPVVGYPECCSFCRGTWTNRRASSHRIIHDQRGNVPRPSKRGRGKRCRSLPSPQIRR